MGNEKIQRKKQKSQQDTSLQKCVLQRDYCIKGLLNRSFGVESFLFFCLYGSRFPL